MWPSLHPHCTLRWGFMGTCLRSRERRRKYNRRIIEGHYQGTYLLLLAIRRVCSAHARPNDTTHKIMSCQSLNSIRKVYCPDYAIGLRCVDGPHCE